MCSSSVHSWWRIAHTRYFLKKVFVFKFDASPCFLSIGPTSCETFLRKIVNDLGGVPCLAIDYSLTVPYPIPLQEVFDVYLWALSGQPDVKEKLGFHPRKIVVSGDSCGGYYSLSLIIALNEINKRLDKSAEPAIPLPVAFVGAYTLFSPANQMPSLGMQVAESLVCSQLIAMARSFYGSGLSSCGDFKRIEKSEFYFGSKMLSACC